VPVLVTYESAVAAAERRGLLGVLAGLLLIALSDDERVHAIRRQGAEVWRSA
jgi:hypothetical protein